MNGMIEMDIVNMGLKTAAMLLIVLGLLVLALYLMKRCFRFGDRSNGDMVIKVLSSLHLSPKERIEVIEVSGEKIVLGIAPGNISFLTKLTETNLTIGSVHEDKKTP